MREGMAKKRGKEKDDLTATVSSGNVFADAGLPDAEERQAKVGIAVALNSILENLNLTQEEIARKIGTDQPRVSAVKNYKLDGLSAQRLMGFLTALGYDIDINIKPHKPAQNERHGYRINVNVAA